MGQTSSKAIVAMFSTGVVTVMTGIPSLGIILVWSNMSQSNHELLMVWRGIFIFGLALSAIVLLIMEVTG